MNFKTTLILFGTLLAMLWIFGITVEIRRGAIDEGYLFPKIHDESALEVDTVELKRDSKPNYQRFMPRVWELLNQDIAHPALHRVKDWFDTHLPPPDRRC